MIHFILALSLVLVAVNSNAAVSSCLSLDSKLAGVYRMLTHDGGHLADVAFFKDSAYSYSVYRVEKVAAQTKPGQISDATQFQVANGDRYRLLLAGVESEKQEVRLPLVKLKDEEKNCILTWNDYEGKNSIQNFVKALYKNDRGFKLAGNLAKEDYTTLIFSKTTNLK